MFGAEKEMRQKLGISHYNPTLGEAEAGGSQLQDSLSNLVRP